MDNHPRLSKSLRELYYRRSLNPASQRRNANASLALPELVALSIALDSRPPIDPGAIYRGLVESSSRFFQSRVPLINNYKTLHVVFDRSIRLRRYPALSSASPGNFLRCTASVLPANFK